MAATSPAATHTVHMNSSAFEFPISVIEHVDRKRDISSGAELHYSLARSITEYVCKRNITCTSENILQLLPGEPRRQTFHANAVLRVIRRPGQTLSTAARALHFDGLAVNFLLVRQLRHRACSIFLLLELHEGEVFLHVDTPNGAELAEDVGQFLATRGLGNIANV